MKFFASFALSAALATTAFAQTISIQAPADGTTVQAGSSITVGVIQHRPRLAGNILYNGPFNPQQQNGVFLQDFTVTIPETASTGLMSLNVAHFTLRGLINTPSIETVNVTLNVV
ncbi:hypothetical protein B0H14DRAFT_2761277 [Mycena olivaceomarginata]|nr:hypothetical protein B0H14DRAFT_2761277 [Mycena olivaceomarginata]